MFSSLKEMSIEIIENNPRTNLTYPNSPILWHSNSARHVGARIYIPTNQQNKPLVNYPAASGGAIRGFDNRASPSLRLGAQRL